MPRRVVAVIRAKGGYTKYWISLVFTLQISGNKTVSIIYSHLLNAVISKNGYLKVFFWAMSEDILGYVHK